MVKLNLKENPCLNCGYGKRSLREALTESEQRIKELEEELSKMKHDEWQDGMNGNTDICHIRELQKKIAEKDKRIKVLEEMLDTSCKQIARLKKENGRILENKMLKSDLRGGLLQIVNDEKNKSLSDFKLQLRKRIIREVPPESIGRQMIIRMLDVKR